ncbi:hypothetical protein HMPREF1419_00193 [Helicobacter pylori GAM263BFi]|nr:hypothetical protein HMPREF1419_00193 [Helicobacter pylori GAM263BFi]
MLKTLYNKDNFNNLWLKLRLFDFTIRLFKPEFHIFDFLKGLEFL